MSGVYDPFANFFRLKKPCANCPFRREGAIELRDGRLEQIQADLLESDMAPFSCHKRLGGEVGDDGRYMPSTQDAMCAGAAAWLMKRGRPTVGMRYAFATGAAHPKDWEQATLEIVD